MVMFAQHTENSADQSRSGFRRPGTALRRDGVNVGARVSAATPWESDMGLDGACSNQNSAANNRLALINSTRVRLLDQGPSNPPREPIGRLRPPRIQREAINVLSKAGRPMRRNEIRQAIETAFSIPISKHSVTSALCTLATDPESVVRRVARGEYVFDQPKDVAQ